MAKCEYCGSEVADGSNFCGACGAPMNQPFEATDNHWDFDRTAEQSGWENAQETWYNEGPQQNYQNYQNTGYGYGSPQQNYQGYQGYQGYQDYNYNNVPYSDKNKVAAGILGILLGALGIHKFYLGYTTTGVVMLLVSILTLGFGAAVMGVIGLVEGVIYLTKSDADFYQTYIANEKKWF